MRTLPLGIALMYGHEISEWNVIMAAVMISVIPIIILVLSMQKYFVRGITISEK